MTTEQQSVFFAKQIHQLNLVMGKFLHKCAAEAVQLVDEAGHLVARQGNSDFASEETVSALVAGTFAASRAMAEMLGAEEYSCLIPCTEERNVLLLRAGDTALVAVTLTTDTPLSLVRTYALELVRKIASIRKASSGREGLPGEHIQTQRFDSEIGDALTDVFG